MLFVGLGKSLLVLNYEINKTEIAETKCENKDKPELHCDGQCYLSKQLKQAEQKENPVPNVSQLKELSLYLCTSYVKVPFLVENHTLLRWAICKPLQPIESCPGSVFQPPEYLA